MNLEGLSEGTLAEAVEAMREAFDHWGHRPPPSETLTRAVLEAALPVLLGELVPREELEAAHNAYIEWHTIGEQATEAFKEAYDRANRAGVALAAVKDAVRDLQRRYERREKLHTSDFTAALSVSPGEPVAKEGER